MADDPLADGDGGDLGADLHDAAVFTFAGPPGSALHLFDAGRESKDGPLVSAGFGRDRSRRIATSFFGGRS